MPIPSQVYPSNFLAQAEAGSTPSFHTQDIPHTSVPPVRQSHPIQAGIGRPKYPQQPGRRWNHHPDISRGRGRGGRGRGQQGRRGGGR